MRVPYEVVAFEVDKLYTKPISSSDLKAIEAHCEYISMFVEACGWTAEGFLDEYIKRGLAEFLPQNKN